LILVDDSKNGDERSATIRAIAAKHPRWPIVVVHDFEFLPYRQAAKPFPYRHRLTGANPNTGVLWDQAPIREAQLRALDEILRLEGEKNEVAEWEAAISSAFSK